MPHLVADHHGLLLHAFGLRGVPLVVGVDDEVLQVRRLQRVQAVEEVVPGRQPTFGQLIREVQHELSVALHVGPEILNR